MLVTIMVFVILTFIWIVISMAAIHNTLMKIAENTAMPMDINVKGRPH
jgi:hypothetical protein